MKKNASKIISLVLAAALTVTSFTYTSFADGEEAAADEVVEVVDEAVDTDAAEDTPAVETDEVEAAPEADEIVSEADETAPEETAPADEVIADEDGETDIIDDAAADDVPADEVVDDVNAAADAAAGEEVGTDEDVRQSTYSYSFGRSNGGPEITVSEGQKATIFENFGKYGAIIADCTNGGKIDNSSRADQDNTQINVGTVLYIPAIKGSTVSVTPYDGSLEYTIAETDKKGEGSYTSNGFDLEDVDGLTYLKLTITGGLGYIKSIALVNPEETVGEEVGASFILWFDEYFEKAAEVNPQTFEMGADENGAAAAVITLVPGRTGESYAIQTNEMEYDGVKHVSYKNKGARPNSSGSIASPPAAGTETQGASVNVEAKASGTLTFYNRVPQNKNFTVMDYYDGSVISRTKSAVPGSTENLSLTIAAKAGHIYACYPDGTDGVEFYGVKFLKDDPRQVSVNVNAGEGVNKDAVEIYLTDVDTGDKTATVKGDTTQIVLNAGHTYDISTNDGGVEAQLGGKLQFTFSGNESSIDIDLIMLNDVTLSGDITSTEPGVDASVVKSITFTKMTDSNVAYTYTAEEAITGNRYSVKIKPGDYNTSVVTTDGSITKDRVKIVKDTDCENEIYLEVEKDVTYSIATEIKNPNSVIKFENFNPHDVGAQGGIGAKMTIPVRANQVVDVTGNYDGEFEVVGNGAGSVPVNSGTSLKATYNTADDDTEITITITAVGNVQATSGSGYIQTVAITTIEEDVPFTSTISVPGDYPTMKDAIKAIKSMKDRPEGEDGRITIELTDDLEEQVNIDVDYITLEGNNHEISFYYGVGSNYYSVDADGYYSESLFRDKYDSREASGSLWGGVVLARGNYFKAQNATFKNTYNYYLTEHAVEDFAGGIKGDRTDINLDVKQNKYRERSNAFAPFGDNIELYNCKIWGSQDSLGTNSALSNHVYFKNCEIRGNCDYICGSGTLVFDDCDLVWFTEGKEQKGGLGYITAPRTAPYIFRNCEIKLDGDVDKTPTEKCYGTFGRPWGGTSAAAYFIRCNTNGTIGSDGWSSMGSTQPGDAKFYEYECTVDGTTPFPQTKFGKIPAADDPVISDDDSAFLSAFLGDWAPTYGEWKLASNIRGDINNDSHLTAMDATALLYAALNPNNVADEWNYNHYIANVAGEYDETRDLNQLIDGEDVQAIMSKVLNYAYEFNTPTTGGDEPGGGGQGGEEPGGDTPTPTPGEPGENFAYTDSYPQEEGWAQEINTAAIIDRANADDVAGNTSAKIKIDNKAVLKILKVPHTSGKVKLSVDFLRDSTLSGRTFRLYVENKALLNYGDEGIVTDDLNPNGVIYHLMDTTDDSFYVMGQNAGNSTSATDAKVGEIQSGKWYRYEVVIDLDAGTSTTYIYQHGTDGTYTEDESALVPVGQPVEANLVATSNGEGNKIAQIRLVRTAAGPVYWDNIKLEAIEAVE